MSFTYFKWFNKTYPTLTGVLLCVISVCTPLFKLLYTTNTCSALSSQCVEITAKGFLQFFPKREINVRTKQCLRLESACAHLNNLLTSGSRERQRSKPGVFKVRVRTLQWVNREEHNYSVIMYLII